MAYIRIRKPGKKVYTPAFYIDTVISTKEPEIVTTVAYVLRVVNRIGILRDISNVVSKYDANIMKVITPEPAYGDKKETFIVIIAETVDRKRAEEIEADLKSIEGVLKVNKVISEDRMLFPRLFPIMVNNERAIVIPQKAFNALLDARDRYGITMAIVINRVGYSLGEGLYWMLSSIYGEPSSEEEYNLLSKSFIHLLEALGWGRVDVVMNKASDGEVVFRIYNNIECSKYRRENRPMGLLTQAIIEGFYKKLWSPHRVKVRETKCIAMGDQYCEFIACVTL